MDDVGEILEGISQAAAQGVGKAGKILRNSRSTTTGVSRHPGEDTPLWNAVVSALQPHLTRRGSKANLARVLGLPRQRIHEYITRPTVLPDAEITLHLLLWLRKREGLLKDGRHGKPLA